MSDFLWVKMPSMWISDGKLVSHFSSKDISREIAALKIYIFLCLSAKVVTRKEYVDAGIETYQGHFEAKVTYDQIMESASLSRVLVSRGLKKLVGAGLVSIEGSTRKKTYVLKGKSHQGWCKLPKKGLLKNGEVISSFTTFTQRYEFERDALKLFLYLLSIRTNSKRYTEVSRGQIYIKTGISIDKIDGVLGFLRSVSLLENVESRGYKKVIDPYEPIEFQKMHRYWVVGNSTLNLKRVYALSEDVPKTQSIFL